MAIPTTAITKKESIDLSDIARIPDLRLAFSKRYRNWQHGYQSLAEMTILQGGLSRANRALASATIFGRNSLSSTR